MKISKLFHWLYAVLMFLPLVMFLPSCLYYSLNENATNTETTTINYKYQSNEVNTLDDLVEGNIYELNVNNLTLSDIITNDESMFFQLLTPLKIDSQYLINPFTNNDVITEFTPDKFIMLTCDYIYTFESISQYEDYDYSIEYNYTGNFTSNCIIKIYNWTLLNYDFLTYTDYNVIESVSVNTDDTITDKVAYAWECIWNLPLFAWTQNSFVSAPFTYITGLFGLQANNSLNYVFTYFCSISICWLVFDLLMYVPNLAHRWLDKGAIE